MEFDNTVSKKPDQSTGILLEVSGNFIRFVLQQKILRNREFYEISRRLIGLFECCPNSCTTMPRDQI